MEIKKENAIAAYNAADENTKNLLLTLLPELEYVIKPKDITERVKTFEDACRELGDGHPLVLHYRYNFDKGSYWDGKACTADFKAFLKLRIVCAALNEGWEPQFTRGELRWFPWFSLWTEAELLEMDDKWKASHRFISMGNHQGDWDGFACADSNYVPSQTDVRFCSRLCLKSKALAVYCGKQFVELWADFGLVKK